MSEGDEPDGAGLSDDQVDQVVDEAASRAEDQDREPAGDQGPASADAQSVDGALPPADPGARDLAGIIDATSRALTGAPTDDGAPLDVTSSEGRSELAGRLLTPAYRRFLTGGAIPWWLGLVAGLALLVGSAYAEAQLAEGEDGDDPEEDGEASPVSEDAATPDDYMETGGSAEPPEPPQGGSSTVEDGDEVVSYG